MFTATLGFGHSDEAAALSNSVHGGPQGRVGPMTTGVIGHAEDCGSGISQIRCMLIGRDMMAAM